MEYYYLILYDSSERLNLSIIDDYRQIKQLEINSISLYYQDKVNLKENQSYERILVKSPQTRWSRLTENETSSNLSI